MPVINGTYYSPAEVEAIERESGSSDVEDFLISAAVGAATGSSILGALAGGSLVGGLFGDALEGTDDSWF